MNTSA